MDITKCKDEECPLKDTCFRYVAKPDEFWQAYFTETPFDKIRNTCDFYWSIKTEENEKVLAIAKINTSVEAE